VFLVLRTMRVPQEWGTINSLTIMDERLFLTKDSSNVKRMVTNSSNVGFVRDFILQ